jgi:hypothetical protein
VEKDPHVNGVKLDDGVNSSDWIVIHEE